MNRKMAATGISTLTRPRVLAWLGLVALATGSCGIGVARDLSRTPPREVIYDDMCGVQDYHDTLIVNKAQAPIIVSTNELETSAGKRRSGGRTRFAFEAPFQLQTLRRLLRENWTGVPEDIMRASRVEIEVRWSEKAGVRRVVTTEDAAIGAGRDMQPLPYHVCLSELLFGAPLYRTRRELLGLSPNLKTPKLAAPPAPLARPPVLAPAQTVVAPADAGAPDARGAQL